MRSRFSRSSSTSLNRQSNPLQKRNKEIYELLLSLHPDAKPELVYRNNFELLIAVILSAQCTDARVNKVTGVLFERASDASVLADMELSEIEGIIKTCGLFHSKARYLKETSKRLCNDFGGEVPSDYGSLISLSGVSRKTANVVRSVGFGIPAIAVDTHVFRVSKRIGLSRGRGVAEVEEDLMKRFSSELWNKLHHLLIFHGRRVCTARSPQCEKCSICGYCAAYKSGDFSYR